MTTRRGPAWTARLAEAGRRISARTGAWSAALLRTTASAVGELIALVLPSECAGCEAAGPRLCSACVAELDREVRPRRVVLPQALPVPVWAGAVYANRVRRVLLAWKDRGRHDVTGSLAALLSGAVLSLLQEPCRPPDRESDVPCSGVFRSSGRHTRFSGDARLRIVMVPVPSRRSARRRRGADLVLELARASARRVRAEGLGVRVVPALHLSRPVADQAGLGRAERSRNLEGALRVRAAARTMIVGSPCLIVDDVITTGATAREALRALVDAGGIPVGIATVCATPLRRGLSGTAHLD